MKKEIADLWVADLRKPENQQCKGRLFNGNGYCCLGRLCVLAGKEFVPVDVVTHSVSYKVEGSEEVYTLPPDVRDWAGMASARGAFPVELVSKDPGAFHSENGLTGLNDVGFSFAVIADIIERHYKIL